MSRIKVLMFSVFAMLAVVAVSSASASALKWGECSKNPGGPGTKYETQASCEALTGNDTGEWEVLRLVGEVSVASLGTTSTLTGAASALVISCTHVESSTDFFDENGMGKGNNLFTEFTGCTVSKPTGCGYVTSAGTNVNGTIELAANLPSLLVTVGGVDEDEISQNSSGEFVNLILEKSKGGGGCGLLPKESKIKGSVLAKVNNATQEFEFEGNSGEKASELDYKGNIKNNGSKKLFAFN